MEKNRARKHRIVSRIMGGIWRRGYWDKFSPAWHYWMRWVGARYRVRYTPDAVIVKQAVKFYKEHD